MKKETEEQLNKIIDKYVALSLIDNSTLQNEIKAYEERQKNWGYVGDPRVREFSGNEREENLNDAINALKQQVRTFEENNSPQKAYFSLLENRSLFSLIEYVEYAKAYIYEEMTAFLNGNDFEHISLRLTNDRTRNRLPDVSIGLNGWSIYNPQKDRYESSFYLTNYTETDYDLSRLKYRQAESDYRVFNNRAKEIEKIYEEVQQNEEALRKINMLFWWRPSIKRRAKENVTKDIESKKRKITSHIVNMQMIQKDMIHDGFIEDDIREEVIEELVVVMKFLQETLGYKVKFEI